MAITGGFGGHRFASHLRERALQALFRVAREVISGDGNPNDRRLGTFNAMFPKAEYFGDIGQLGPANLINLRPNFGLDLGSGWKLSGAVTFFWRQSLDDGIDGTALNLIRPDGVAARATSVPRRTWRSTGR